MSKILLAEDDTDMRRFLVKALQNAGFEVTSALGNEEARRVLSEIAEFALVVVGWSTGDEERREMVRWVKQQYPALRVRALYSSRGHAIAEGDFNSRSEKPEEWFTAVKKAAVA